MISPKIQSNYTFNTSKHRKTFIGVCNYVPTIWFILYKACKVYVEDHKTWPSTLFAYVKGRVKSEVKFQSLLVYYQLCWENYGESCQLTSQVVAGDQRPFGTRTNWLSAVPCDWRSDHIVVTGNKRCSKCMKICVRKNAQVTRLDLTTSRLQTRAFDHYAIRVHTNTHLLIIGQRVLPITWTDHVISMYLTGQLNGQYIPFT